jgi:D-alanyl-D-alanine carboxypeptidase
MLSERPNDQGQRLLHVAREFVNAAKAPGASIAILRDGAPLIVASVGSGDTEGREPLTPDARCYVYSITKTLTATIVLRLAERELLALDDDVRQHLPQVALPAGISVRQLLNHTSGLPDYGASAAYQEAVRSGPADVWSAEEFLTRTLPLGMRFEPGSNWSYSNIGYLLLKLLIECVTGDSFTSLVQAHITAPLGLQHMRVVETLAEQKRLIPGYTAFFSEDGALQDMREHYHPGWVAHGVVAATALETAQAIDAIVAGELLTPASRAAMLAPVELPFTHPYFGQPAYGIGVMLDTRSPFGLLAGHGGGGPGYDLGALHASNVRGQRVTAVAFINRDVPDAGLRLAHQLLTAVEESEPPEITSGLATSIGG